MTFGVLAGFAVVFAIFQGTAAALGSDRGQWGLVVATVVVAATVLYERFALTSLQSPVVQAFRKPKARGMYAAVVVAFALMAVPVVAAAVAGWAVRLEPGTAATAVGIFAQAGIAEETLFRSYLFGHLREGRTFWRAAWLSLGPFAAVHVFLFWTMPWPIAAAALALSCIIAFPLAWLYEMGGRTVWAPAILHAVSQGLIKVVVVSGPGSEAFPLIWMAACAVLPLFVLMVPVRPGAAGAGAR
jgi:membrane protease YdiL (CAAX protease family)